MTTHQLAIHPEQVERTFKQHTLRGLTASQIESALGFAPNMANDADGKTTHVWGFLVEGEPEPFAIWDYRGSYEPRGEWSAFGDASVLRTLFPSNL